MAQSALRWAAGLFSSGVRLPWSRGLVGVGDLVDGGEEAGVLGAWRRAVDVRKGLIAAAAMGRCASHDGRDGADEAGVVALWRDAAHRGHCVRMRTGVAESWSGWHVEKRGRSTASSGGGITILSLRSAQLSASVRPHGMRPASLAARPGDAEARNTKNSSD